MIVAVLTPYGPLWVYGVMGGALLLMALCSAVISLRLVRTHVDVTLCTVGWLAGATLATVVGASWLMR